MSALNRQHEQRSAISPVLLTLEHISALMLAVNDVFDVLYDIEIQQHREANARLAVELARVNLLGLTANQLAARAEEYQPS